MEGHSAEEVRKHIKVYVSVFVALLFLTVVTVAVSYLHLSTTGAIVVAMIVACIKGSLVACYFMHLISEKSLILNTLILTAVLFGVLMMLPNFTNVDKLGM